MLVALLVSPVAAQTISVITPPDEYQINFNSTCTQDGGPTSIIAGRDGNLWFTERFGNKIGRITPTGACITFSAPALLPAAPAPTGLAPRPICSSCGPPGSPAQ